MAFLERCFWLRLQKARPLLFPFGRTNREETGVQLSFPGGSDGKESACSARDPGSIPRSGGSTGEGHGNPLQYSCLENPIDKPGGLQSTGPQRVGHSGATTLSLPHFEQLVFSGDQSHHDGGHFL